MAKQPPTPSHDETEEPTPDDTPRDVTERNVRWYQHANAAERAAKARKKVKKSTSNK